MRDGLEAGAVANRDLQAAQVVTTHRPGVAVDPHAGLEVLEHQVTAEIEAPLVAGDQVEDQGLVAQGSQRARRRQDLPLPLVQIADDDRQLALPRIADSGAFSLLSVSSDEACRSDR